MFSAEPNHVEDQAVIQYLLGGATEEQTELLDRLSVADEDFARRLQALEDDLVDGYVRGELSGETLQRFRTFYLSSPLRRSKVQFAEKLLPLADRHQPVPLRRAPVAFSRLVLAAAASLLIAAGAYWMLQVSRPQPRTQPDLSAAAPPAVPPLPAPLANIVFVLVPPTRSPAALPVLALPAGAGSVTFRLQLEVNDSRWYRAVLKDLAEDQVVWRSQQRAAEVVGGVPSVVLSVPAQLFKNRAYSLDLTGIDGSGAADIIGAYAFRMALK
jgi:hypothetical protein